MSRNAILSLGTTALVILLIAFAMRGVDEVRCEVCIEWEGQSACRTGVGRTREDAQRAATESACAVLASAGMAERIRCGQSRPASLDCR